MNKTRVFVYGTLKAGNGNHAALRDSTFLGRCYLDGQHKLISMGYYPGVVRLSNGETNRVYGEVYSVTPEVLAVLDMIEGHPDFYTRIKIRTPWENAWIYTLDESFLQEHTVLEKVWMPSDAETAYMQEVEYGGTGAV